MPSWYSWLDKVLANFTLLGGVWGRRNRPQTPPVGKVRRGLRPLRTFPTVELIAVKRNLVRGTKKDWYLYQPFAPFSKQIKTRGASLSWNFSLPKLRIYEAMPLRECDILVIECAYLGVSSDRIVHGSFL